MRVIVVLASAIVVATAALNGTEVAMADGRCLDNSGGHTVLAGASYSDAGGDWVCDPTNPEATGGGWVRKPLPTQAPAPTLSPTLVAPDATATVPILGGRQPGVAGGAPVSTVWIIVASAISVATPVGVVLYRALARPRLSGWLIIEEEHHE